MTSTSDSEIDQEGNPADLKLINWRSKIKPEKYSNNAEEKYQTALLEQYKLYVEMADRLSARRNLANTFFLTLNTAALTVILSNIGRDPVPPAVLIAPFLALAAQCIAWFLLMRSYRLLSSAKYRVIGGIENALPARPYAAEWEVIKIQRKASKYLRLTWIEQWIPAVFAGLYATGFFAYSIWRL